MLPLQVSVLWQSVLPSTYVFVLQQPKLPLETSLSYTSLSCFGRVCAVLPRRVCPTAACAAFGRSCPTAARLPFFGRVCPATACDLFVIRWTCLSYSSLSCLWMCLFYSCRRDKSKGSTSCCRTEMSRDRTVDCKKISNGKPSIVEERKLCFVFVPYIVEERILCCIFVP